MLNYFRRKQLRNRVRRVFGVPKTPPRQNLFLFLFLVLVGAVLGIIFLSYG